MSEGEKIKCFERVRAAFTLPDIKIYYKAIFNLGGGDSRVEKQTIAILTEIPEIDPHVQLT